MTLISLFQAVTWFDKTSLAGVLAIYNIAFIAGYIPHCLINDRFVECMVYGGFMFVLATLDMKFFFVHPYEVRTALNE